MWLKLDQKTEKVQANKKSNQEYKTPAYKERWRCFRWSLNDAVLQIYCNNSSRWHSGNVAQHTKERWTNMTHSRVFTLNSNSWLKFWLWDTAAVAVSTSDRLKLHINTLRWAAATGPSKLMTLVSADDSCLRYFSTHKQLTDLICYYQWLPICTTCKHEQNIITVTQQ